MAEQEKFVIPDNRNVSISTPAIIPKYANASLAHVKFQVRRHDHTALLQLRFSVALRDANDVYFYVIINPSDIQTFDHQIVNVGSISQSDDRPTVLQTALHRLGSQPLQLQFTLSSPPTVVGPRMQAYTPRNDVSGRAVKVMRALSRDSELVIYIARNVLSSEQQMENLFTALNARSLGMMADEVFISRLYKGQGGQIVFTTKSGDNNEAETNAPASSTVALPPLPSYAQVPAPPPPPPFEPLQCKISPICSV